ncbi:MAG: GvpL/GvpF family gas vesicle protein [Planctomycetota bacterium]|nr:GvpL/GvpF family gas vesicle protein [Planctomycetota bacterium]
MKQLVYAVLATQDVPRAGAVCELQGHPLVFVAEGPLTAACSAAIQSPAVPGMPQLLAFAQLVQELFSQATVLPLRYGCWLEDEREVRQLLSRNEAAFQASLQLVQGCIEMEISILPNVASAADGNPAESQASPAEADSPPDQGPSPAEVASRPGTGYLLARQHSYAVKDDYKDAFTRLTRSVQNALAGLYVKSVAEQHATRQGGLWSLYFLVRRNDSDRFRGAFAVLQGSLGEKLLLTGPWPPYNFVSGKTPEHKTPEQLS